ncbi:MAG: fasciclin domain-containing protein [Sphingomonadaceae bacterium]|nr:fasciclin domain-containing protein [Sphingomonadaceae bacterium]
MNKLRLGFALLAAPVAAFSCAVALSPVYAAVEDAVPTVGGAPMYPTKNIVENAVNSRDHTTLVAAVQAAGLVETLQGTGPFTVFAPVNAAFERLPAGTVPTLLRPENRGTLTSILTYHVVPGRLSAANLMAQVRAGGGRATLTTAQGGMLTVTQSGNMLVVTDAHGGQSRITQADVNQSNGVIHVVDSVLMP